MKKQINEIKRMQQLAGILNENQLNENGDTKINTHTNIKAPPNKFIIGCSISGDGTFTKVKGMNGDEILHYLQSNYDESLENLIGLSDAEDYTIGDSAYNESDADTYEYQTLNLSPQEGYVNLFCFIDVNEENKNERISHWMNENQPTIYLTKL